MVVNLDIGDEKWRSLFHLTNRPEVGFTTLLILKTRPPEYTRTGDQVWSGQVFLVFSGLKTASQRGTCIASIGKLMLYLASEICVSSEEIQDSRT